MVYPKKIDTYTFGETRVSSLRTYYSNVKNAFPGRENLALEGKNSYRGTKGCGHTQLQTNADIIHMIGKLEQQVHCPSVTALCSIAEVSRAGYYNWLDTEEARKAKEEQRPK